MSNTISLNYRGVGVTIAKDWTGFADYPNDTRIISDLEDLTHGKSRELISDPVR